MRFLKCTFAAMLCVAPVYSYAAESQKANSEMYFSTLLHEPAVRKAVVDMVSKKHFPKWLLVRGGEAPAVMLQRGGNEMFVVTTCKPHDCMSQRVAMAYVRKTGQLTAVYAVGNDARDRQVLVWYGVPPNDDIELPSILYAALTGALGNDSMSLEGAAQPSTARN